MFEGIRNVISKAAAMTAAIAAAALSAVRTAFAASTDSSLPPEYTELLRLAHEKVQAATQPGAFGNGTPLIGGGGGDLAAMLPWVAVAACVAATAAVAAAVKALRPKMSDEVMLVQQ
jgi:hypothetical protein